MKTGKYILLISLFFFFINSGCKPGEEDNNTDKYLKSYKTLTLITVTEDMIDELLNSFNEPALNDGKVQNLTIHPVKMYKISFRTIYKGKEIIASGTITMPQDSGEFPVLIYHHGTIFKDSKAPSNYKGTTDIEAETALNLIISSTGYISISPDYTGYGESTNILHPYHIEDPTVSNIVDMIRAAKELFVKLNVSWTNKFFITGYSEGGYTGMSLQKAMETEYSSEFELKASSLGAGAYYLSETIKRMMEDGSLVSPAYISFIIMAYNNYYGWERDPSEFFKSPYDEEIKNGILNGSFTQREINNRLNFRTKALFRNQFLFDFRNQGEDQFKKSFAENDLFKGWVPSVPTRLYHGTSDKTVPPFNSITARNSFYFSGANEVEYIPLKNKTHETAILPWIKETLIWFDSFK